MSESHQTATLGAGVLLLIENHVLLVQMNYGRFKGSWILPGGMVEQNERPHEAALREAKEETNLDLQIQKLHTTRHRLLENGRSNVYLVYESTASFNLAQLVGQIRYPEEELQDAKFWAIDDALKADQVRPHTKLYIQMKLENNKFSPVFSVESSPSEDWMYF